MSWFTDAKLTWFDKFLINLVKCGPIPRHVAFIMDGNRRYAKKQDLKPVTGYLKGFDKLAEILLWCKEIGITEVTAYAFSIDNLKRTKEEVDNLMNIARDKYKKLMTEKDKLMENGVCIRVVGNLSYIPEDIAKCISEAVLMTKHNNKLILNLAFSYTSREEMTTTVKLLSEGVSRGDLETDDIDVDLLCNCMYTGLDPDILVRTSGETRFSDFFTWQCSTALIYFAKVLWPECGLWHLLGIIFTYQMYLQKLKLNDTFSIDHNDHQKNRIAKFLNKLDNERVDNLQYYAAL